MARLARSRVAEGINCYRGATSMTHKNEPTQAMPDEDTPGDPPKPTQPIDKHRKQTPLIDDEGFGGFMGHGGQTDITDETDDDEGNPNATAQSD